MELASPAEEAAASCSSSSSVPLDADDRPLFVSSMVLTASSSLFLNSSFFLCTCLSLSLILALLACAAAIRSDWRTSFSYSARRASSSASRRSRSSMSDSDSVPVDWSPSDVLRAAADLSEGGGSDAAAGGGMACTTILDGVAGWTTLGSCCCCWSRNCSCIGDPTGEEVAAGGVERTKYLTPPPPEWVEESAAIWNF